MQVSTVEPRFYDHQSKDVPDLTNNILRPGKIYESSSGEMKY